MASIFNAMFNTYHAMGRFSGQQIGDMFLIYFLKKNIIEIKDYFSKKMSIINIVFFVCFYSFKYTKHYFSKKIIV